MPGSRKKPYLDMKWTVTVLVLTLVVALPLGVYFSLDHQARQLSQSQAQALTNVISTFRGYYATNVAGRILSGGGTVTLSENYHEIQGGVPIPATLSIELGSAIAKDYGEGVKMSFTADASFLNRNRPAADAFQLEALKAFRSDEGLKNYSRFIPGPNGERMRLAVPVAWDRPAWRATTCTLTLPSRPGRSVTFAVSRKYMSTCNQYLQATASLPNNLGPRT